MYIYVYTYVDVLVCIHGPLIGDLKSQLRDGPRLSSTSGASPTAPLLLCAAARSAELPIDRPKPNQNWDLKFRTASTA